MESEHTKPTSNADPDLLIMAGQIAERCCARVLRRLSGLKSDMSVVEARSYIRTRSAAVVQSETQCWLIDHRGQHLADSVRLIETATELLVEHFLTVHRNSTDERHAA